MIKFDAILDYDDDSGDPTHYTIVWDGKDIAEISKHKGCVSIRSLKRTYQVLSRQTLSAAYFDTELEALEYVIELIRVLENE